MIDLALKDGYQAFTFLDEGGWRDAEGDTRMSLDAIRVGKRTKTALSNSALNCTPLTAFAHVYLAKSSGDLLELQPGECIARFKGHASAEKLAPDQVAEVACLSPTANRRPPLSRHRSDRDAGAFQPDSSRVCLVCDAPF